MARRRGSTTVALRVIHPDHPDVIPAIADRLVHRGLLIRIGGRSRRSDQTVEPTEPAA